jgi:hypothetical protein
LKTTLIAMLVTAAVMTPSAVIHAQGQTGVTGRKGSDSLLSRGFVALQLEERTVPGCQERIRRSDEEDPSAM